MQAEATAGPTAETQTGVPGFAAVPEPRRGALYH